MEEFVQSSYKDLFNKFFQFTYRQITEFLGMKIIQLNKQYCTLQKGERNFLVFKDKDTNSLRLYDVTRNKLLDKDELLIEYYHLTEYDEYKKAMENFPSLNEFSFDQQYTLDQILGLYYGNLPRSRFPDKYQSSYNYIEDPWFAKFITYHPIQKRFSLPMFNNNTFGVVNFVDFADGIFHFRFRTPFSLFYTERPSNSYKHMNPNDINESYKTSNTSNHLILSFNPFLLIESRETFRDHQINYYPVLLEPTINSFKFYEFCKLVNPFLFEKILILYSKEKEFYSNDLLNAMLFLIHTLNFSQKDYIFDYDFSNEYNFTLIIRPYLQSIDFLKLTEILEDLKDMYANELSVRNNPDSSMNSVTDHMKFLKEHGYDYHHIKFGKELIFILKIPMKVETTVNFCKWLIKTFLMDIELINYNGTKVFNSSTQGFH